jgi:hypothetical protein
MKLFWLFFLYLFIYLTKPIESFDFASFKLLKCSFNSIFVYSNYSCYAKSYSRNMSTTNGYVMFKKPINKLYVRTSHSQDDAFSRSLVFHRLKEVCTSNTERSIDRPWSFQCLSSANSQSLQPATTWGQSKCSNWMKFSVDFLAR